MKTLCSAAAMICAGAVPVAAQTPPPPATIEAKSQALPYVMAAGRSDLYEIQSSQIALQKSQNEDIREFAQDMIEDHTETTADTMEAARDAGLNPPQPTLDAGTRASIEELQNASPAEFDRLYLGQQIPAHRQAFGLHSYYANAGDESRLRRNARKATRVISRHLKMANKMQREMSGS